MKNIILATVALLTAASAFAHEARVYTIDPVHSGIQFKIRHFLNKVPGTFSEFSGTIHYDPEHPEKSSAKAEIIVSSVDTRNDDRDGHLMNEDFFMESEYPKITFESTEWKKVGDDKFEITGMLTILGKSKPVVIETTYLGEMEGRGKMRSGWEGKAVIDRTEWGLSYGATVGTIGSEVEIELNIQAHRPIEKD